MPKLCSITFAAFCEFGLYKWHYYYYYYSAGSLFFSHGCPLWCLTVIVLY